MVVVSSDSLLAFEALTLPRNRNELASEAAASGPEPAHAPGLTGASTEAARRGGVGRWRAQMPTWGGDGIGGSLVDGGGGGGGAGGRWAAEPVAFGLLSAGGAAAAERYGARGAGAGVHGARADAPARGGASHESTRHHPSIW